MKLEDLKDHIPSYIGEEECHRSSVMIPLIPDGDDYRILFQLRSAKIKHQPGDACFPGGMREDGETAEENAIREMMEELLVSRDQIRVLGPIDILRGPKIQVEPYVCILSDYDGRYSEEEVAEVFTVPLSWFLTHDPERHTIEYKVEMPADFPFEKIYGGRNYAWRKRTEEVLFYEPDGRVIWGMTARIVHSFISLLKQDESLGTGPFDPVISP